MSSLRRTIKRCLLWLVGKLSEDDETKRSTTRMLSGLLDWRPAILSDLRNQARPPYPELGRGASRSNLSQGREPIFVTGRFRSGSTLLWNLYRNVEGLTAYYEPLNERRWFDPIARGSRMDPTHKNVAEDYWREYDGLDVLGRYYREDWIHANLYMDGRSWDPGLKRYIEILVERAPGRPVLQFNRVDFRLPWLKQEFPEAKIVHLYRHPRDQWCSVLMDPRCFPKDAPIGEFGPHDKFYVLMWARDLKYHFPFLDERTVAHPYQLFYYLWKLSYLFGMRYADYTVQFETLIAEPDSQLPALFKATNVEKYDLARLRALVERPAIGKWKAYAGDDWFAEHEAACEAVLAEFLSGAQRSSPL